jgi:hypothetical protein
MVMWIRLRLNVNAVIVAVGIVAVVFGLLGGRSREADDWPYPLYILRIMVVTFAFFILLVPVVKREYRVSINPTEGLVRIGRRTFPASEVSEVLGMYADNGESNSQVDYILNVHDPKRKKPVRGRFAIKLPYVKARTAAEFEAILSIVPMFGIRDDYEGKSVVKRNRTFQPIGKNELLRIARFELERQYPGAGAV